MTFDPRLLDALENAAVNRWTGEAWRVVVGATEPLKANMRGACWNPPGQETLYCSLEEETAIKEIEYLLSREPVQIRKKRVLNGLRISLSRIVVLEKGDELSSQGISRTDLLGDPFTSSQLLGEAVHWLGIPGLIVPSARSDAQNLIVFPECMGPDDVIEILSSYDYSVDDE